MALDELGNAILRASMTDAGDKTQELAFYACNADSYLMPIADMHGMLVPVEDADKLVRMLKR